MERQIGRFIDHAEDCRGETLVIDAAYVEQQLATIAKDTDLSKYVL